MTEMGISTERVDGANPAQQNPAMRMEMLEVFRLISSGTRAWLILWNARTLKPEAVEIGPHNEGHVMGLFTGANPEYPRSPYAFCRIEPDGLVTQRLAPSSAVFNRHGATSESIAACIQKLRAEASANRRPLQMNDFDAAFRAVEANFRESEALDRQEFMDLELYKYGEPEVDTCFTYRMREGELTSVTLDASEETYTPLEIAKLWSLKATIIRQMFADEPDVIWVKRLKRSMKRKSLSMLIPKSVVVRVGQEYGLPSGYLD